MNSIITENVTFIQVERDVLYVTFILILSFRRNSVKYLHEKHLSIIEFRNIRRRKGRHYLWIKLKFYLYVYRQIIRFSERKVLLRIRQN
jgi:hypothetical protein